MYVCLYFRHPLKKTSALLERALAVRVFRLVLCIVLESKRIQLVKRSCRFSNVTIARATLLDFGKSTHRPRITGVNLAKHFARVKVISSHLLKSSCGTIFRSCSENLIC
jgi:hypothetical protein